MNLDRIGVQFRAENMTDDGRVEGWASTFDTLEPGYDTIFRQGAFHETLRAKRPTDIKMLLGHDAKVQSLVGVWESFDEQPRGLYAKGQLIMDLQDGRDTFARAKAGALDSLSIGFVPTAWEDRVDGNRQIREFTSVDLWEVSFVVFRGNPGAKLTKVRDIKGATSKRQLEEALHASGLSLSEAKYICSLVRFGDTDENLREVVSAAVKPADGLSEILAALRGVRAKISNGGMDL